MSLTNIYHRIQKYITNSLWILSENILRLLAGFFVGVYVARYMGPSDFGVYNYALSIITIITPLLKLGMDNILVKEFVNNKKEVKDIAKTAIIMKGSVAFVLSTILFIGYAVAPSENALFIMIMSIGYIFQALEVFGFYYQSVHQNKKITQCKLIQLLVSSLMKLIAIYMNATLFIFVILYVIDLLTLYLSLYIYTIFDKNSSFIAHGKFSLQIAKKLINESWPFVLSGVAGLIYMRADQIMINNMLGEQSLGEFSAAVRLSEVVYMIPNLLLIVIFPVVTRAYQENKEKYEFIVQRLFDLMVLIAIAIIVPIAFFSKEIIHILYGSNYDASAQILKVHIFCAIFVFIGISNSVWVINENLGRITLIRTVLAALLNVGLNLLFIPKYGAVGAAYATCFSQFMASVGFNILTAPTRIWFYRQIKSIITCGIGVFKFSTILK